MGGELLESMELMIVTTSDAIQQVHHRLVPVLCRPRQRRTTVSVLGVRVDAVLVEVDKIIRIILSREGLQVPYIHEVLS